MVNEFIICRSHPHKWRRRTFVCIAFPGHDKKYLTGSPSTNRNLYREINTLKYPEEQNHQQGLICVDIGGTESEGGDLRSGANNVDVNPLDWVVKRYTQLSLSEMFRVCFLTDAQGKNA